MLLAEPVQVRPTAPRFLSRLSSGFHLDCPGRCFRRSWDSKPEHAIRQACLDLLGIKIARQRKLALEITDLILSVNRAVTLRAVILDLGPDVQNVALQRDVQALRRGSRYISQEHEPLLSFVDVDRWPERPA